MAHVFVSPVLDVQADVLGCLLHELVHAALPAKVKHGGAFRRACTTLGFVGKPSSNSPGPELTERINVLVGDLEAYPHVKLDPKLLPKPQRGRLRLYECSCPVKVRVASDEFQAHCDMCEGSFTLQPGKGDESC